ncbi:MAG: NAD(P)-binding protein [Verrucomicrobiota bacterium]
MFQQIKFVILGAGPSGLAFAHTLLARGEESFVVLEKESEPGGLCRSTDVDGWPLDIGGGHFLDVRNREVLELLFRFMPECEWNRHSRVAKIRLRGVELDHPLEGNLWQLPIEAQVDYLEGIARAGCVRGEPIPTEFEGWCRWKFGAQIADEYMLPYNRKLWRIPLNDLGTYWLYKLPDVSFRDTLMSCLQRQMHGALPAHGEFLYPKTFGYGEVWKRMGDALGYRLRLNTPVHTIDVPNRIVNGKFQADTIVNSIPWSVWSSAGALPADIAMAANRLLNVPIDVDYHSETVASPAHWIYEPDERVSYHRILCRTNFAPGAHGHWTETNARISPAATGFRHRNEFAYPVNTIDKPRLVENIHAWAQSVSVLPLGRWGHWEHMNSDVAVSSAIKAATEVNK